MTPSFPRWILQEARRTWQQASTATKLKIDLLLLSVVLAERLLPPSITVLGAGLFLTYMYRLYRRSMNQMAREDDSQIHADIGDSLSDDSLRWALTAWSRRYRP
ncbi:hypothetical protein [Mycobacterium aquaticum]|uniref:Uncharacterized protein n=1 Tax=Mycobacterium aquaticum TaxID=1927124 RepID=A0A1X0A244_9MYCO|nr:hypothetical protein [Mycobacterium aquaticum]ORA24157.1 hypothetical protein BST13_34420 [Mycobacterium aquaticum]